MFMNKYDSILKRALFDAAMIDIKRIESLPLPGFAHTEEHKARIADIFEECLDYEERSIRRAKRKRALLIAAIIAALAFTITACTVIEPIRSFIVTVTKEATSFDKGPGSAKEPPSNIPFNGLDYIPEGFVKNEDESLSTQATTEIVYYNNEKRLSISRAIIAFSSESADSEGSPAEVLKIDGYDVYLFTKWKNDLAVWHDEYYRYSLIFPEELGKEELIKMIKSVQPLA